MQKLSRDIAATEHRAWIPSHQSTKRRASIHATNDTLHCYLLEKSCPPAYFPSLFVEWTSQKYSINQSQRVLSKKIYQNTHHFFISKWTRKTTEIIPTPFFSFFRKLLIQFPKHSFKLVGIECRLKAHFGRLHANPTAKH